MLAYHPQLIMSCGGRVCLSDDSHGVRYVGLNYLRMRDYLVDVGLKEIWYLVPKGQRRDVDQPVGRRGNVAARRLGGSWADQAFWRNLARLQSQRDA